MFIMKKSAVVVQRIYDIGKNFEKILNENLC